MCPGADGEGLDVKSIRNRDVNYEIWFLEGLPSGNVLLLSLWHPLSSWGVSAGAHVQAVKGNGMGWGCDGS